MGNASSNPEDYKGKTIFDYEAPTLDDKTVSLSEYKGKKAYLVVNVASHCGLTNGNYKELNDLYNLHKDDGLEILAFPSDNFGGQEFQDNNKIKEFTCSAKINAKFPIFGRVHVENGDKTLPLFQYLKYSLDGNMITGNKILWNFAKFLCNEDGVPIKRYAPTTGPMSISQDIEDLINK